MLLFPIGNMSWRGEPAYSYYTSELERHFCSRIAVSTSTVREDHNLFLCRDHGMTEFLELGHRCAIRHAIFRPKSTGN